MQDPEAAKGRFGFAVDNTIGGTSQPNGWMDNWIEFFRERRLQHQLQLAGALADNVQQTGSALHTAAIFEVRLLTNAAVRVCCLQATHDCLASVTNCCPSSTVFLTTLATCGHPSCTETCGPATLR